MTRHLLHTLACGLAFAAVTTAAGPALAADADRPTWPVAGRQGVVRHVLVPLAMAADRAAYQQQIAVLCPDEQSCFLNFYTNSTGADVVLPLPEAIAREATAVFRRSQKRGADSFQWRCGLQVGTEPCF